jgi:hypothetical protein
MEHLQENDVEANNNFDNLLGRKAKRRRKRRRTDRKRGRKMRLRAKYGGIAPAQTIATRPRPMPRPNAYADAGIDTQVQEAMVGGNPYQTGLGYLSRGGSSADENRRGAIGGVIGKLFGRRKRRNRKHKKLLRAINNPSWLQNPKNHYKLKEAVRGMAIQSNNDGKTAEEMIKFSQKKPMRRFPVGKSWGRKKPFFKGSRHYGFDGYNADGSATEKSFIQKYGLILGVVAVGGFLFFTPQGKKLIGRG